MNAFNKLTIYYFSGTGNAYNTALWISETASHKGIRCSLINITRADINNLPVHDREEAIVFVSPIHGFNYPPVMLHFLRHFPKGKNKVYLLNTRAGMLIGKKITPGLTGIAFYFASLLLITKGYKIWGLYPVDMPSNWISVHPGLNERTVKYLHEINKERVIEFAELIFNGNRVYKALKEVLQDLAVSPAAILYYFIGRFILAKTYYASSDCNNCNVCIKNCPVKAIKVVNNHPFWTLKCESCMRCMSNCPVKAIETAHGFVVVSSFFIYGIIISNFYYYFNKYIFSIQNETIKFVLESAIFLGLLTIYYRLVHYLLRFRFIERIMVYTSLTKYKFWGRRYKALKQDAGKNINILQGKN